MIRILVAKLQNKKFQFSIKCFHITKKSVDQLSSLLQFEVDSRQVRRYVSEKCKICHKLRIAKFENWFIFQRRKLLD